MAPIYVGRVPSAGGQDYRDLARSLQGLLEVARRTLVDEEEPTELVARVTGHLRCELSDVVAVHERFEIWDHVNVHRGVEAYLTRHGSVGSWFGMTSGMMRPHQDLLSRLARPAPGAMGRAGSASYGTVATGPDTDTEVVTLGLVATTAPGGAPAVIGIRAEREFGPPYGELEILAADRAAASATRTELEHALADRPGRVDLAIEIPRPDAACREQLLRLYTREVALDGDTAAVVAATEGVTASYVKELVRRGVLAALRTGERPLLLRQAHFDEVLAEMSAEHQSLTRSLLGGDAVPGDGRPQRTQHRPRR
jgi:hypothetical protein